MPKYLVLYKSTGAAQEHIGEPSPEQGKAMMQAWLDWKDSAGDAIVDFGAPTSQVSDGESSGVGGYSIVQADSAGALPALFESNPHCQQGGALEVHELIDIPGP